MKRIDAAQPAVDGCARPRGNSLAAGLRRVLASVSRSPENAAPAAQFEISALQAEVSRLAAIEAQYNRWREVEPVIEGLLSLGAAERLKILSTDQGQYTVGTGNASTRDAWVSAVLTGLPPGTRLLDAGAGECQYKKHCGHLRYVAQDNAVYDASSPDGLQNAGWNFSGIDLVCDIVDIPEPDGSFDAVMCTEVLEHLPDPVRGIEELARLLRPGGIFILTAPFWSLTHQAPYHFATGFNRYFYEHHLGRLGFEIVEMTPNGNFFECIGQEVRRVREMASRFTDDSPTPVEIYAMQVVLGMSERMSRGDRGSPEMLHYDYQVRAVKHEPAGFDTAI
jgi:SAM-dependent methyltransferase